MVLSFFTTARPFLLFTGYLCERVSLKKYNPFTPLVFGVEIFDPSFSVSNRCGILAINLRDMLYGIKDSHTNNNLLGLNFSLTPWTIFFLLLLLWFFTVLRLFLRSLSFWYQPKGYGLGSNYLEIPFYIDENRYSLRDYGQ